MKLKLVLNSLLVSIPLVLSSGCDDIDVGQNLLTSISKCTENEEGKITGLSIINSSLGEEEVNKLLSYDLTNLSYTIAFESSSYDIPEHPGYSEIPEAISNLKNLESLIINFSSYLHPCASDCAEAGITNLKKDTLKDLKKLKSLSLTGIKISQDNIDEISTLENLETLSFYHSFLSESLNYKPLGNLQKLYKLYIENQIDGYVSVDKETFPRTIPKDLVKSNKGIKELSMILDPVSIEGDDLPNLEKLKVMWADKDKDLSFTDQFDKLTDLEFDFRGRGINEYYHFDGFDADFSKLKNLNTLVLMDVNITDSLMNGIGSLSNLEKLTMSPCLIADEGFSEKLKNLKNLSYLNLSTKYNEYIENSIQYLTNLNSLSLHYMDKKMTTIPEYIYTFTKLEYLNLSNHEIKNVDDKINNLENLKHLDLSRNALVTVPEQLSNLKKLEYFDLSRNELVTVPKQLSNLEKLEYLDLSSNQIYDQSPEFLNNLENLKYFNIDMNEHLEGKVLTNKNLIECQYSKEYDLCIPKDVEVKCLSPDLNFETCVDDGIKESTNGLCGQDHGKCPNGQCCGKDGKCGSTDDYCLVTKNCQLKYGNCIDECQEYVTRNGIKEANCITDKEGRIISVTLNEYDNREGFQKLLNELPNFHSLEKLNLGYMEHGKNDLSPLNKIEKLDDLTINSYYFFNYDCELKEIPEYIFSLTNLKRLTVTYNDITAIPDSITKLKNLEYLDVSNNALKTITPRIAELENLKELKIELNAIEELPDEIGNLKSLEIFDMSNCHFKELPKDFGNLKNLKTLDLSYNKLTKFPEQIAKLESLEKLDLKYNEIDDEIPKSYNELSNLTEINVATNKNIRGETLTNKNLGVCIYNGYYDEYPICRHGNETCLDQNNVDKIKLCENSSINTTTTTKSEPTATSTFISSTDKEVPTSTIVDELESTTSKTTTTTTVTITTTSKDIEPTNREGKCGEGYGKCPSGYCCSKYGWCGKSDDHCDAFKGCQSEFGECKNSAATTITTSTTTTSNKPEPTQVKGKCGEGYGKCPSGYCCSKYGWCGKSDDHCDISKGCDSKYGTCKGNQIVEGKCGEGYGKCPSGYCCSKYGWCGKSSAHCNTGCQSEFGKCN